MALYPIILAGGSGTRLWPLSRKYYPKQFVQIKEMDNVSLFQQTLKRTLAFSSPENLLIVANEDYKYHCINQADEIGIYLEESQIIIQPSLKGTLAAITLSMSMLPNADDVGLVLPSDHIIDDVELFGKVVTDALGSAEKSLVTFGIEPTEPCTGYGYIQPGQGEGNMFQVQSFKEKPNAETAQKYIDDGYLWNAGIFLFSKGAFFSELEKADPKYHTVFSEYGKRPIADIYDDLPDLSIDYGLMEHSSNILVSPLPLYWNDLGSFDAIRDYAGMRNIANPNLTEFKSKDNFVLSEVANKKITIIGIWDVIVVDTKDALLLVKKGDSQDIKHTVQQLQEERSALADYGSTVYRPWGSYTIIDEGHGFKTKRITVLPGKKLSLQMHYHRSEHWVVVSGTARVINGEQELLIQKGESTFIPAGTKHRLENPGKTTLHLIESQIGDYVEEDDIVRFDDVYGRG